MCSRLATVILISWIITSNCCFSLLLILSDNSVSSSLYIFRISRGRKKGFGGRKQRTFTEYNFRGSVNSVKSIQYTTVWGWGLRSIGWGGTANHFFPPKCPYSVRGISIVRTACLERLKNGKIWKYCFQNAGHTNHNLETHRHLGLPHPRPFLVLDQKRQKEQK